MASDQEVSVKDQEVSVKVEDIAAVKGLGTLTIAVVLAETNGFLLFDNVSQPVSYAGYDVVKNQSGTRTSKTKKGNSRIRLALHPLAVLRAFRCYPSRTAAL